LPSIAINPLFGVLAPRRHHQAARRLSKGAGDDINDGLPRDMRDLIQRSIALKNRISDD
jgi:hypothetical protein